MMNIFRPKLTKKLNKSYQDEINDEDEDEYDIFKHKKHGLSAWRRLHFPLKESIDLILGRTKLEVNQDGEGGASSLFSEYNLSTMFADLDTDNDGLISKNDFREWVRIQQRSMLGGFESTIRDEEIEAFFQAGSSSRIPVLTTKGLSDCFKRHSILAFDWNNPLGHSDNPNEIKEKILTQIATIFARLDTDNDGRVYPEDIRIWRKMVYFGSNENKLIYSLMPDDDSDSEEDGVEKTTYEEFENKYCTYAQFHNKLLTNFTLYTEMSLQSIFMEVIVSTYYEKLKNVEVFGFSQVVDGVSKIDKNKKKSKYSRYYTKDSNKLEDSYRSPDMTSCGENGNTDDIRSNMENNNELNSFKLDSNQPVGKINEDGESHQGGHEKVRIEDIGDAELISEVKEFFLSDSKIDSDYLAFTCVAKLRMLRVGMALIQMDIGRHISMGEDEEEEEMFEEGRKKQRRKSKQERRVSLKQQRSTLTADMFDRMERARGRVGGDESRGRARSRSRNREGSGQRIQGTQGGEGAQSNEDTQGEGFRRSSYSSAAASMEQSDIDLMVAIIDGKVADRQFTPSATNTENTINLQQADMMVRAMDVECKSYIIVDDIQAMLEELEITTITRDDLALLIYDAQVLVKSKRSSSVLVGRQEATSKYNAVQLQLTSKEWMHFLNRAGMENIALNLFTCIERQINSNNKDAKHIDNEHIDLSFLLSPRLKKKSVIEGMVIERQESRTSLSGVTSLKDIMKSKSAPFLSPHEEQEGGVNGSYTVNDVSVREDSLVGASILDHLLEPFQLFMCADLDEDGFINANDVKKWLLSCHVSETMLEQIEEEIDSLFNPNLPLFGSNTSKTDVKKNKDKNMNKNTNKNKNINNNRRNGDDSLRSAVSSTLSSTQTSDKSAPIILQRKYAEEIKKSQQKSPHKNGINSLLFEKACKRRPNVIILISTLHYFHMLTNQCREAMSLDKVELEAINHATSSQYEYLEEETKQSRRQSQRNNEEISSILSMKKRICISAAETAMQAILDAELIEANRFICIPITEQDRLGLMYMNLDNMIKATENVFSGDTNHGKFSEDLLHMRRNIISLRALGTNRSVIALELDMCLRIKQLKHQENMKFKEQINTLKFDKKNLRKNISFDNHSSNQAGGQGEPRKAFTTANKSKSLNLAPVAEWSCTLCTYKNKGMILMCEICNTPKQLPSLYENIKPNGQNDDFKHFVHEPLEPPPPPPDYSPSVLSPRSKRAAKSKSYTERAKPRGINL